MMELLCVKECRMIQKHSHSDITQDISLVIKSLGKHVQNEAFHEAISYSQRFFKTGLSCFYTLIVGKILRCKRTNEPLTSTCHTTFYHVIVK